MPGGPLPDGPVPGGSAEEAPHTERVPKPPMQSRAERIPKPPTVAMPGYGASPRREATRRHAKEAVAVDAVDPVGVPAPRRRPVARKKLSQNEALFGKSAERSMSQARQAVRDAAKILATQSAAEYTPLAGPAGGALIRRCV